MNRSIAFPIAVSALVVTSCQAPAYHSSAQLGGINIEVQLVQSHPFLAEYKRLISVEGKRPISLGLDSGGISFVNAFETSDKVILQTFHTHVLVIDKATKDYTLEKRPLSQSEIDAFSGSFKFVERGRYEFVRDVTQDFDPSVMKGG